MSERFANKGYAVDPNAPTASIEAPSATRIAPPDMSGEISETDRQYKLMAEIPRSLASMVLSYNDYTTSVQTNKEKLAAEEQYEQDMITAEEYASSAKLFASNEVFDKEQELQSKLLQAQDEARKTPNGSVLDATNSVLADNRDKSEELPSPFMQQLYSRGYQDVARRSVPTAFKEDVVRQEARLGFNFFNIVNEQLNTALQNEDPETAINNIFNKAQELLQDKLIDETKFMQWTNAAYNSVVSGYVSGLVKKYADDPGVAAEKIQQVINTLAYKKVDWIGKDGKPLLDAKGNPYSTEYTASHIESIYSTMYAAQAQEKMNNTVESSGMADGFRQEMDMDTVDTLGVSSNLISKPDADFQKDYEAGILKCKSKTDRDKFNAEYMKAYMVREIAKSGCNDANITNLEDALDKLETELAKGGIAGWSKYGLKITSPDGKTTRTLYAPTYMKKYINDDGSARLYWQSTLGVLRNTVRTLRENKVNFLAATNSNFRNNQEMYHSTFSANKLLLHPESSDTVSINTAGVSNAVSPFLAASKIAMNSSASGSAVNLASLKGMISKIDTEYKMLSSDAARAKYLQAVGQVLQKSGVAPSVLKHMQTESMIGNSSDLGSMTSLLGAFVLLSGTGKEEQVVNAVTAVKGKTNAIASLTTNSESAKEIRRQALAWASGSQSGYNSLSPDMRASLIDATALLAATTGVNQGDSKAVQSIMDNLVKSNFVRVPEIQNGYIYKHSANWVNTDEAKFKNTMSAARKKITSSLNAVHNGLGTDIQLRYDENSGNMYVARKTDTGGYNVLSIIDSKGRGHDAFVTPLTYARKGTKYDDRVVSDLIALNVLTTTMCQQSTQPYLEGYVAEVNRGGGAPNPIANPGAALYNLHHYHNVAGKPINAKDRAINVRVQATRIANILSNGTTFEYLARKGALPQGTGTVTVPPKVTYGGVMVKAGKITKPNVQLKDVNLMQEIKRNFPNSGNVLKLIEQKYNTYKKISQVDVSTPISKIAAEQNTTGMDTLALAKDSGFVVSSVTAKDIVTSCPEVADRVDKLAMAQDDEEPTDEELALGEGMTGAAANINNTKKTSWTKAELVDMAETSALQYGIPLDIAHKLIRQESGFKVNAKSPAGASGIMQLMPATAKGMGVKDIWDPAQNIEGGMKYLALQYRRFGQWDLALAAYNAGPNAVKKYGNKIPPFRETQNYVKNILHGTSHKANTYALSFSINDNSYKFIDQDTGMLSVSGMNSFVSMLGTGVYKNSVNQVQTNRPELLEDKPEYADFAKYRKMKTADGKPLFVKGDVNGFRLSMKGNYRTERGINPAARSTIAQDMVNNQTDLFEQLGLSQTNALLSAFDDRYDAMLENTAGTFGLADLSYDEYAEYGVPLSSINNPVFQARVLAHEFQRAIDVLGNERKALYALAGGALTGDNDGKPRKWSEIKADRDAKSKDWLISTEKNATTRKNIYDRMEKYMIAYDRQNLGLDE